MRPTRPDRSDAELAADDGQPTSEPHDDQRGTQTLAQRLTAQWQRRGWCARLLLPLSVLYSALVMLRRLLYQFGVFQSRKLPVPVIVVGNVISGGAGKTPTTIAIVQHLKARGRPVGVVSRGYGRTGNDCMLVHSDSTPEQVGDEPLLMHRLTDAPVAVGPSRYEAAQILLKAHAGLEVLVCDDGLQHYGLFRDIEVCVFDNRGCGNGWLLPAGPMREPWPRRLVATAGQAPQTTLVLHTGDRPAFTGYRATRTLSQYAQAQDGRKVDLLSLPTDLDKPIFAVAGIAQPEVFFDMLRASGVQVSGTLGLADHADFKALDMHLIENFTLLCTEKDAVKLWRIAPQALAVPLVQTIEPVFHTDLDRLLATL